MRAGRKSGVLSVFLLVVLLPLAAQAADGSSDQNAVEPVQEQMREQEEVRVQAGNTPAEPGSGKQRNANSEQAVVRGPEVKQGPYGDKQNHKQQGNPDVAGSKGKSQKGRN